MNDEYTDSLLSQGFQGPSLNPALQQQFLDQSSLALSRTYQRRRWTKRACYTAVLALGLALGFAGGRVHEQQATSTTATNTIEVPQDIVAWLEAARLFTQINLEERADFAYARASQLARSVHAEQQLIHAPAPAPSTDGTKRLANLLAQYESLKPRPGSTEKSNSNSLMATVLGETR